jgi:hypothetical protein
MAQRRRGLLDRLCDVHHERTSGDPASPCDPVSERAKWDPQRPGFPPCGPSGRARAVPMPARKNRQEPRRVAASVWWAPDVCPISGENFKISICGTKRRWRPSAPSRDLSVARPPRAQQRSSKGSRCDSRMTNMPNWPTQQRHSIRTVQRSSARRLRKRSPISGNVPTPAGAPSERSGTSPR